jgi:hypothetical protein
MESDWQARLDMEREQSRAPSASGRNREQAKQALQHQISDARAATQIEIERLNLAKAAEQQRHEEALQRLRLLRDDIAAASDVSRSQARIAAVKVEDSAAIEAANRQTVEAIAQKRIEMETVARQFAADISSSKKQTASLTANFTPAKQLCEREMCGVRKQFECDALSTADAHRLQFRRLREGFSQKRNELTEQTQSFRIELQNAEERNSRGLRDENERQQLALAHYTQQCRDEQTKQRSEEAAMLAFLVERMEVLIAARDAMRGKFENQEGRPCDIAMIRSLVEHLRTVKALLASKVKDLVEYRSLFVGQDKAYNSKFGARPTVGVLRFVS